MVDHNYSSEWFHTSFGVADLLDRIEALEARNAALVAGIIRSIDSCDGRHWDMIKQELLDLAGYTVTR
jgi:hypothetical protein